MGQSIKNPLDLAGRAGSQVTADRLAERERAREQLRRQLWRLEGQRAHSRLDVSTEVVLDILAGAPIPHDGPPLCPKCHRDEQGERDDYRDEQDQARRPF